MYSILRFTLAVLFITIRAVRGEIRADRADETFRFANVYADHMVLQRGPAKSVIWGFGEEKASVSLTLVNRTYTTKVAIDDRGLNVWKVELEPMVASGPYKIRVASQVDNKLVEISLKDVYFGDIWVCGGQSNMAFSVSRTFRAKAEIKIADSYKKIRLFTVQRYVSKTPIADLSKSNIIQRWQVAGKYTITDFSALCWMYGRRLFDLYKIPIGLISTNYGGTSVEAWSSPETLRKCGITEQDSRNRLDPNMHSGLWNGMLYPFLNMTIYGVIWYQGEQNAYKPSTYNCTFPAMIEGWRKEWNDGTGGNTNKTFPFGFVQLSALGRDIIIDGFPVIRWKQTAEFGYVPNARQKNTFMAVTMDLMDQTSPYTSIHPRDKTTVAKRLLLGGRTLAYNENLYWTGPVIETVKVKKVSNTRFVLLIVIFHSWSLTDDGIEERNKNGFEIFCTSTQQWKAVELYNSDRQHVYIALKGPLSDISAIRYAWNQGPCAYKQCAIYAKNKDLPTPPFIMNGPFEEVDL